MPRLSVWFIRAALLHLIAGFTLGALLLIHKGTAISPWIWRLRPAHIDLLLIGWTVQLAMGVAYWILPRFWQQRGNILAAWTAFILLNAGVLLSVTVTLTGLPAQQYAVSRLLQAGAVLAFAVHAWPRVKPAGG